MPGHVQDGGATRQLQGVALEAVGVSAAASFTAVGGTLSHDFPTLNAHQDSFAGGSGSISSGDLVSVRFEPIPESGTGALLFGTAFGLLGVRPRRRSACPSNPASART